MGWITPHPPPYNEVFVPWFDKKISDLIREMTDLSAMDITRQQSVG